MTIVKQFWTKIVKPPKYVASVWIVIGRGFQRQCATPGRLNEQLSADECLTKMRICTWTYVGSKILSKTFNCVATESQVRDGKQFISAYYGPIEIWKKNFLRVKKKYAMRENIKKVEFPI